MYTSDVLFFTCRVECTIGAAAVDAAVDLPDYLLIGWLPTRLMFSYFQNYFRRALRHNDWFLHSETKRGANKQKLELKQIVELLCTKKTISFHIHNASIHCWRAPLVRLRFCWETANTHSCRHLPLLRFSLEFSWVLPFFPVCCRSILCAAVCCCHALPPPCLFSRRVALPHHIVLSDGFAIRRACLRSLFSQTPLPSLKVRWSERRCD